VPSPGKFDLEERLLEYAAAIIRLSEALPQTVKKRTRRKNGPDGR
jgi:hypothetical protein